MLNCMLCLFGKSSEQAQPYMSMFGLSSWISMNSAGSHKQTNSRTRLNYARFTGGTPPRKHVKMARAPKQWSLTNVETITSFESWRHNLIYTLSLDTTFSRFLDEGFTWEKKTTNKPYRGLYANFCPIISSNSIVKGSTYVNDIWQKIKQHYGLQILGVHSLDLAINRFQQDKRPADLFQHLCAFYEDNRWGPHSYTGKQDSIEMSRTYPSWITTAS